MNGGRLSPWKPVGEVGEGGMAFLPPFSSFFPHLCQRIHAKSCQICSKSPEQTPAERQKGFNCVGGSGYGDVLQSRQ